MSWSPYDVAAPVRRKSTSLSTTPPRADHIRPWIDRVAYILLGAAMVLATAKVADSVIGLDLAAAPASAVFVAVPAIVYFSGLRRRRTWRKRVAPWRPLSFYSGLAALLIALQWSIAPLSTGLFYVQQVQHVLLRIVAPMLLALSVPLGVLTAGLPRPAGRAVLRRICSTRLVRSLFAGISHPISISALFLFALCLWQLPPINDTAVANAPLRHVMHATLFGSGLIFWWRIFDLRPAPMGARYGVRLMMLWLLILTGILVGASTTLNGHVLYAHHELAAAFGLTPLADEQVGGIFIWIISGLLCVVAAILTIHSFGVHEESIERMRAQWTPSNSDHMIVPTSGSELVALAQGKNRRMAWSFALFSSVLFISTVLIGVANLVLFGG